MDSVCIQFNNRSVNVCIDDVTWAMRPLSAEADAEKTRVNYQTSVWKRGRIEYNSSGDRLTMTSTHYP